MREMIVDVFAGGGGASLGISQALGVDVDLALTHREWQIRFARAYCCRHPDGTPRRHAGRIQGKALLWAEFHGGVFHRLLGRAELPKKMGVQAIHG